MPSDAEVVEVLSAELEIVASDGNCNPHDVAKGALTALRSAGYAVVKAGEMEALVEAAFGALRDLENYPRNPVEAPATWIARDDRRSALRSSLYPFTKDPTND